MDREEALDTSQGDQISRQSPSLPHTEFWSPALKWQPDKLVLKKPRGNQSTPLAHNYLSFNKTINALSESDRYKLGNSKIDSLVGGVVRQSA